LKDFIASDAQSEGTKLLAALLTDKELLTLSRCGNAFRKYLWCLKVLDLSHINLCNKSKYTESDRECLLRLIVNQSCLLVKLSLPYGMNTGLHTLTSKAPWASTLRELNVSLDVMDEDSAKAMADGLSTLSGLRILHFHGGWEMWNLASSVSCSLLEKALEPLKTGKCKNL
jgi:hypothetical protein